MIDYKEALKIVNDCSQTLNDTEKVRLPDAVNRITAEDLITDIDMPQFDRSSMDGFAVTDDSYKNYIIKGVISAGDNTDYAITGNETYAIMTGARIPAGTGKIVIRENARCDKDLMEIVSLSNKINISFKGEDSKAGSVVLKAGVRITPFESGIIAAAGRTDIDVRRKIRTVLAVTGDEITDIDGRISMIRDINSDSLKAAVSYSGIADVVGYWKVSDDFIKIKGIISDFLKTNNDVLIITGGSSIGDFDYTQAALEECGVNIRFSAVRIKPGKPTIFGTAKGKYFFGLPGNPVSALFTFSLFCKPCFNILAGYNQEPIWFMGSSDREYSISSGTADRVRFLPVEIKNSIDGIVFRMVHNNGSGHILSLAGINYFVELPIGINRINTGERFVIRQVW